MGWGKGNDGQRENGDLQCLPRFPYRGGVCALSCLSLLHRHTYKPDQAKLAPSSFAWRRFMERILCNGGKDYWIEIPLSPRLSSVIWGRFLLLFGSYFAVKTCYWRARESPACVLEFIHLLLSTKPLLSDFCVLGAAFCAEDRELVLVLAVRELVV